MSQSIGCKANTDSSQLYVAFRLVLCCMLSDVLHPKARLCVLVLSSDRRIALFVCVMIELVFHYYLGKSMPELAILASLRMLRREFKIRSRTSFSGIKNTPYKLLCYENRASPLPPHTNSIHFLIFRSHPFTIFFPSPSILRSL